MLRRFLVILLGMVFLGNVVGTATASAHAIDRSYLWLFFEDGQVSGRVEMPFDDLEELLGVDLPADDRAVGDAAVAAQVDVILPYAMDHLAIGDGTVEWNLRWTDARSEAVNEGGWASLGFVVDEDFENLPKALTVTFDPLLELNPNHRGFLIIARDWESGTYRNIGGEVSAIFGQDDSTQRIERDPSFLTGFVGTVELGMEHIEIGPDHILFIIALVLPAVILFRPDGGFEPSASFSGGLWRILKVATMFTIAHSITLLLGGFGIIELPSAPVEILIAISIVAAALHNFYPIFRNKEWVLAFGFGLFHGLGFAGLLADLGLTRSNRLWSLLGFNLGVEIGQVIVILLVFPMMFLIRRTAAYPRALYGGSIVLAIAASAWGIERTANWVTGGELAFFTDRMVEEAVAWPRAFWLAAALTVLAFGYERQRRSSGLLRPVAGATPANSELTIDEVDAVDALA
jgi:hypothetical protein